MSWDLDSLFHEAGGPDRVLPSDSEHPDFVATVRAPEWEKFLSGEKGSGGWLASVNDDPEIVDGDAAWWSRAKLARQAERGSRLYICSRGRLRLWVALQPINPLWFKTDQEVEDGRGLWIPLCIDASPPGGGSWWQPVTLDAAMPGFRGLRRRWWSREMEIPCPDWKGAALGLEPEEGTS